MGFISADEFFKSQRSKCGNAVNRHSEDITFATNRTGYKDKTNTYSMAIGISQSIAKLARIIPGDRVDILFDPEQRIGLIKRVNSGGWKLSGNPKGNSRLYFRVPWHQGMPSAKSTVGCLSEIVADGIQFIFPDEISFTQNLRKEQKV